MSRTKHHGQNNHAGHDYGARYKVNRHYGCAYGKHGRDLADKERRESGKKIIRAELNKEMEAA